MTCYCHFDKLGSMECITKLSWKGRHKSNTFYYHFISTLQWFCHKENFSSIQCTTIHLKTHIPKLDVFPVIMKLFSCPNLTLPFLSNVSFDLFHFTCEGVKAVKITLTIYSITSLKVLLPPLNGCYNISITDKSLECLDNGVDISLYAAFLVLIIYLLFLWVNQLYDYQPCHWTQCMLIMWKIWVLHDILNMPKLGY